MHSITEGRMSVASGTEKNDTIANTQLTSGLGVFWTTRRGKLLNSFQLG